MNPLHPSIAVGGFESVQTGSLELRAICQSCWLSTAGCRSLEEVERIFADHKCSVSSRECRV
jgi:hypothetical protein